MKAARPRDRPRIVGRGRQAADLRSAGDCPIGRRGSGRRNNGAKDADRRSSADFFAGVAGEKKLPTKPVGAGGRSRRSPREKSGHIRESNPIRAPCKGGGRHRPYGPYDDGPCRPPARIVTNHHENGRPEGSAPACRPLPSWLFANCWIRAEESSGRVSTGLSAAPVMALRKRKDDSWIRAEESSGRVSTGLSAAPVMALFAKLDSWWAAEESDLAPLIKRQVHRRNACSPSPFRAAIAVRNV